LQCSRRPSPRHPWRRLSCRPPRWRLWRAASAARAPWRCWARARFAAGSSGDLALRLAAASTLCSSFGARPERRLPLPLPQVLLEGAPVAAKSQLLGAFWGEAGAPQGGLGAADAAEAAELQAKQAMPQASGSAAAAAAAATEEEACEDAWASGDPFAAPEQQAAAAWGYEEALSPAASARSWPYNRGQADSDSDSSCDGIGVRPTAARAAVLGAPPAAADAAGAGIEHAPSLSPGAAVPEEWASEDAEDAAAAAASERAGLAHATSFAGFGSRSLPGTPQAMASEAGARADEGFAAGRPAPVAEEVEEELQQEERQEQWDEREQELQQQQQEELQAGGSLDAMFADAVDEVEEEQLAWRARLAAAEAAQQEQEQREQQEAAEAAAQAAAAAAEAAAAEQAAASAELQEEEEGAWGADWSSAQPQQEQEQPEQPTEEAPAAAQEQQQEQPPGSRDGSPEPGTSSPALSRLMSGRISEAAYPAWSQQNSAVHSRWAALGAALGLPARPACSVAHPLDAPPGRPPRAAPQPFPPPAAPLTAPRPLPPPQACLGCRLAAPLPQ
jgi:hypothetical protein